MNSNGLREALFDSILRQDAQAFNALCTTHSTEIVRQFEQWSKVPEEIRQDMQKVETWVNCLMTIAKAFESAGFPQLLMSILEPEGGNPIEQWMQATGKAQRLSEIGQYRESNEILLDVLENMQGAIGGAVDDIKPKILGQLGTNYFRLEEFAPARQYTEMALEHCDAVGDRDGVLTYTENLATTLSLDSNSPAARTRESIAKAQELADQLQYERSNTLLDDLLKDVRADASLSRYLPKIHGLLGSNHYRLGAHERAARYTEQAKAGCSEANDAGAVRIYEENLRVIGSAVASSNSE